ncbi:MAG TPA: beta-glucuronidase [Prevotella sp.]|nr:beta-glucuronidase [Prevotella sp.]
MKHFFVLLTCIFWLSPFLSVAQHVISLQGTWEFNSHDTIQLPGSMLTNGKGDPVSLSTPWMGSIYDSSYYYNPYMAKYRVEGHLKFPFFLTPDRHFIGHAKYTKTVFVPDHWKRHRVVLFLERPHIETTVWINGRRVGHQMSLSVPHCYDVTDFVHCGTDNQIDIDIYNGVENVCVGQDSHSVTDQTQGDWNGIIGRIELQEHPRQYITNLQVFPDIHAQSVRVHLSFASSKKIPKVTFHLLPSAIRAVKQVSDSDYVLSLKDIQLWDEFHPNLYRLSASCLGDSAVTTFGMREMTIRGRQFYMNGRPIWIRGTVENCDFPLTGYPPTDVPSWKRIFRICKDYGLNFMRFHSYCPPEAAFIAADQVGFYLQPEGPSWPNHGVKLGTGMPIDRYLMEETQRMVKAYGNHPSFCMMAAGNEPAGDWVKWCNQFVDYWKKMDSRRVYAGASVGGGWAWDTNSEYHVKGGARGLDWTHRAPSSDDDYYGQIEFPSNYKGHLPNQTPIIAHEQGQWCAFPDLKEVSQYTGVYQARNFEIFRDLLADHGMAEQTDKFLHASGKLQVLAYKYEIERNLRTKDYAGFALLGLNDYSGQGTALVGPLNVFWREKGYVTATEWRQWCSPVVPLARFKKFVFTQDETLDIPVDIYHAGAEQIHDATVTYAILMGGKTIARGSLLKADLPLGKNLSCGRIRFPLAGISAPAKLTLRVDVAKEGVLGSNSWEFWTYPSQVKMPEGKDIYITDSLDQQAHRWLEKGGKVLITAAGKIRYGQDVVHTYLPVFWNTSWFKMRPPHTTGAFIQKDHPVFAKFPTDDWQNLNWWELVNHTQVMNLSEFPKDYQPIVQPIDTWHVSRKLGMLIEVRIGKGKLLMTTMDITNDLDHRVVARQLRQSILDYMESSAFQPSVVLNAQTITDLFERQAQPVNMYTKESPDELKPKIN